MEVIESDSHWLNCSKGCNWGVHSRSVGIHYEKWAKDHCFCAKHMSRAETMDWDAEKDVLLEKKLESFKTRANKIKKKKIKKMLKKKCNLPLYCLYFSICYELWVISTNYHNFIFFLLAMLFQ